MPDLYPIPGFGPEEILEMARSAIRQANDYKICINLQVHTHTLHEPPADWSTEIERCQSQDGMKDLTAWAKLDREHFKPLVINCEILEHNNALPVPACIEHSGIFSRQTEINNCAILHRPMFRREGNPLLGKGSFKSSTKLLTDSSPLKITAKNHND